MAWEHAIFIGCTHGDLICPKAVKIVKSFMEDWKPKWRIHLGDLWDFRALRRGADAEDLASGIRKDFDEGIELLDWYQPQIITLGNHDHRIWRAAGEYRSGVLAEHAQDYVNEAEEEFRNRRIKWLPWGADATIKFPVGDRIHLHHGYRSTKYPAAANFETYGESIGAHVHKPDVYYARHIDKLKAFTVGTLGRIPDMKYADGQTAKTGWRNSFLYSIHNTKTGSWEAWPVIKQKDNTWLSPQGIIKG